MGPRAGLDRCGKSRPLPGFDPRIVQLVANRYTDYVQENNLETRTQAKFLAHQLCEAVLDTGCQCSVINEELCKELKFTAVNSLELPAQNVVLMRAFQGKTTRVKLQVMLELNYNRLLTLRRLMSYIYIYIYIYIYM